MTAWLFTARDATGSTERRRRRPDKRQRSMPYAEFDDADDTSSQTTCSSLPSGISIEFPPAVDDDDAEGDGLYIVCYIMISIMMCKVRNNTI